MPSSKKHVKNDRKSLTIITKIKMSSTNTKGDLKIIPANEMKERNILYVNE